MKNLSGNPVWVEQFVEWADFFSLVLSFFLKKKQTKIPHTKTNKKSKNGRKEKPVGI